MIKVNDIECTSPGADMFYQWGSWITFKCGRDGNGIKGDRMVIQNTYPGHLSFCGLEVYGNYEATSYDGESDSDDYYYEDDEQHWDDYMDDYYYEDDRYDYHDDQCHESEDQLREMREKYNDMKRQNQDLRNELQELTNGGMSSCND